MYKEPYYKLSWNLDKLRNFLKNYLHIGPHSK